MNKQLSHPKHSVRKSAIIGLRELFQTNLELLVPSVGELIKKVSSLFADQHESVRHALYLLLKHVFQVVDQKTINPFFPLLLASIKCGLTHINSSIQTNSVKITDLLIHHYPELIKQSINSLLPLYLPLVAMKTQQSASKSKKFDIRGIYVTKQPILSQLLDFMSLKSDATTTPLSHAPLINAQEGRVWPRGDPLSPPQDLEDFYQRSFLLLDTNPSLFGTSRSFSTKMSTTTVQQDDSFQGTGFEKQFIKVLLELWIEIVSESLVVAPPMGSTHDDIYSLLTSIIQLLCLIMRYFVSTSYGKSFYHDRFVNHFLPYYPIHQKNIQQHIPPNVFMLNVHFSQLIILMAKLVPSLDLINVNYFLISQLPQATSVLSSHDLVKCVSVIIDIINITRHLPTQSQSLDYSCFQLFVSCHPASSAKNTFLKYIHEVTHQLIRSDTRGGDDVFCHHFLYPCLSTLPKLLAQLTSSIDHVKLVLQVLKLAMACQIDTVLAEFQSHLPKLYGKD